jgi:hypothetical protein
MDRFGEIELDANPTWSLGTAHHLALAGCNRAEDEMDEDWRRATD